MNADKTTDAIPTKESPVVFPKKSHLTQSIFSLGFILALFFDPFCIQKKEMRKGRKERNEKKRTKKRVNK